MRRLLAGVGAMTAATLVFAQGGAASAAPVGASPTAGPPAQRSMTTVQRPLTAAQAAALSRDVNQHVIIFLRDEPGIVSASRPAMTARSAAIAASQSGIVHELAQVHATRVISYRLVNAVAATVSAGEETRLEANPDVAKVIPDAVIELPSPSAAVASATTAAAKVKPLPGSCRANGGVGLEPEALQVTNVQSQAKGAKTARSLGFTGAGVTVAYIADGVDIHNVNFIKADGKSVFSVYKDFSGSGTSAPTGGGGEAFLDANSIAGQGRHVYSVQDFSAHPLTEACNVRIEGVAPGVSLVGLRVSGVTDATTTSTFLDAINYATVVHKVNVLNESFGSNPIPDTSVDAIKEFDDAAVKAGITVVAAAGDSSPGTDTMASPATDPNVISVGASTDFRSYAMSDFANADVFARTGWLDDNISNISSSGFNESGAGIDLVAPGDDSFTSCTANLKLYPDCTNFRGKASDVQLTGGTSQASPLTAGVAALVIQAYRHTHHDSTPSPSLVKQIIMSSATDLGSAGDEQGAGLLNGYKAVELAESYKAKAVGDTLLTSVTAVSGLDPAASSQGQIDIQDEPGSAETATFTVLNTGATTQTVHVSGRQLGAPGHIQAGSLVVSNERSKHLIDFAGYKNNYSEFHFTVARGQNRLNASMSYPGTVATYPLSMILITPKGQFAAYSYPQGESDDANLDVINPAPGRWTGVVFGPVGGAPLNGVVGTVHYRVSTQRFVSFGTLSRRTVTLGRGKSAAITLHVTTPAAAGDATGSVVLNAGHGASTIPVLLRSYVAVTTSAPGTFRGTLTGGNGRGPGVFAYYQFVVPADLQEVDGMTGITASVRLNNDPSDLVDSYLVDPDGQVDGYGSNYYPTDTAVGYATELTAAAYALNPIPGTWTLLVEFIDPTGGNETSDPYSGAVSLKPGVTVSGGPSGTIPSGGTVQVPVTITNDSPATEDFFLDPRLDGVQESYRLYSLTSATPSPAMTVQVPMSIGAVPPEWLVPTESSSLTVSASATSSSAKSKKPFPFTFDTSPVTGDPDVPSYLPGAVNGSTTPSATASAGGAAGPLTAGLWYAAPSPAARTGFSGAADTVHENAKFVANAEAEEFDTTVQPDTGDLWQIGTGMEAGTSFNPVILAPGQSATIEVDITPPQSGGSGTDSGTLYVDDFAEIVYPSTQLTGSEVAGLPYSYKY
jgi:Subtilase family